jgi:cytochrome c peroxidase
MRRTLIAIPALAALLLCASRVQIAASDQATTIDPSALKLFAPLPANFDSSQNPSTPAKVRLGRMLYYDKALSRSQTVSCNTCHMLNKYGVDGEPTSTGFKGQHGTRNSPTVYNAAAQFRQFWDGRAADVEEQAKGPVLNPVEMAMPSAEAVTAKMKSIPGYRRAFEEAFPGQSDPVTFDNAALAIGAFERGLTTPSRWDRFLKGDSAALTPAEKKGFQVFVATGCPMCHSSALLGGTMYQKLGLVKPYPNESDLGRYDVTKNVADRMLFKVPPLRNVTKTGPYFHDGQVKTLNAAVSQMAEYQLGKQLKPTEVRSIVTWLGALTGSLPEGYIKEPVLPVRGRGSSRAGR